MALYEIVPTLTVKRGDDVRIINESDLGEFVEQGFSVVGAEAVVEGESEVGDPVVEDVDPKPKRGKGPKADGGLS